MTKYRVTIEAEEDYTYTTNNGEPEVRQRWTEIYQQVEENVSIKDVIAEVNGLRTF